MNSVQITILIMFGVWSAFRFGLSCGEDSGWGMVDNVISFIVTAIILLMYIFPPPH